MLIDQVEAWIADQAVIFGAALASFAALVALAADRVICVLVVLPESIWAGFQAGLVGCVQVVQVVVVAARAVRLIEVAGLAFHVALQALSLSVVGGCVGVVVRLA